MVTGMRGVLDFVFVSTEEVRAGDVRTHCDSPGLRTSLQSAADVPAYHAVMLYIRMSPIVAL